MVVVVVVAAAAAAAAAGGRDDDESVTQTPRTKSPEERFCLVFTILS